MGPTGGQPATPERQAAWLACHSAVSRTGCQLELLFASLDNGLLILSTAGRDNTTHEGGGEGTTPRESGASRWDSARGSLVRSLSASRDFGAGPPLATRQQQCKRSTALACWPSVSPASNHSTATAEALLIALSLSKLMASSAGAPQAPARQQPDQVGARWQTQLIMFDGSDDRQGRRRRRQRPATSHDDGRRG